MSAPSTMQWIRTAGTRISTGSGRLIVDRARRLVAFGRRRYEAIAAWLARSSGLWWLAKVALLLLIASRTRIILFAVAERLNERLHSGAWGGFLFTAAGLWLIAAYRAGHPDWEPKQRPAQEQSAADAGAEEQTETAVEELPDGPRLPAFHELCEALARVGTPHAHIAALAEDLGTTPEQVREALDRCGVAVEPVRMRGRGSSTGVKGGALPAPRPGPDGVVAAGHPTNNDNNNTPEDTPGEGLRVEPIGLAGAVVRDPADVVRHHKVRGH